VSACSLPAVIANARPFKYVGPRIKLMRQRPKLIRKGSPVSVGHLPQPPRSVAEELNLLARGIPILA
jgi:hypothetical protein